MRNVILLRGYDTAKSLISKFILYFANAFCIHAIIALLINDVEDNFLHIGMDFPFAMMLAYLVIAMSIQYHLQSHDVINPQSLFYVLVSIYILVATLRSPSALINIGFYLLAVPVFYKACSDKSKCAYLIPAASVLSLPKTVLLRVYPYKGDLGRFAEEVDKWNIDRIIIAFVCILVSIQLGLIVWAISRKYSDKLSSLLHHKRVIYIAVAIISAIYIINLCIALACKVKTYAVSTFDVGLFSQMFEYMKTDFVPLTTLERDELLSHFKVHVSPTYYLMLPFYALFNFGSTLDILQTLFVVSGVVPLYLILKKMTLPEESHPFILLLYVLLPTMTSAGSYHIHENCFLAPMLLWLIYANMAEWRWRLVIIMILTLGIKEDAFLYVVIVALYFFLQNRFNTESDKTRIMILLQIILPLLYFATYLFIMPHYDEGNSLWMRGYDIMASKDQGTLSIILQNPTYVFSSFFTQQKLQFLFPILLSVLLLPLLQKKWETYILLLPFIAINLLSSYTYQTDLGFQYTYGSVCLLFFMALLSLEGLFSNTNSSDLITEMPDGDLPIPNNASKTVIKTIFIVIVAAIMSASMLYCLTSSWYNSKHVYRDNREKFDSIHETLNSIPTDKKVLAYHTYTVDLRKVRELYDTHYHNDGEIDPEIEIVVVPRSQKDKADKYINARYIESDKSTDEVLILEKP